MKFSEKWLREWVNPAISTEALAHQLTMAGLEVDAIDPVAPPFSSVMVGQVLEAEPHPDADKLRVCKVDVGGDEPLQIVCGAPNARPGIRVPTAVVGAVLPGDFKIKKAKLRGVESRGMLCSAKELGLNEEAAGLMELPTDAPVGTDLREYLGLEDHTIELGLTPNRGDCLSLAGIAREVGVLNRLVVSAPSCEPVSAVHEQTFPVQVEAKRACPRYLGRVIRGIDNRASTPVWMQERLRRSGIRSLGPVVDVTNYVLLELGQPMHGFDLARLQGSICVRHSRPGDKLTLLNGSEVILDEGTLMIADDSGPLALAGIMGGESSGVTDETRDIFFESAFFSPDAVVGRARRYGLHTDSSHRFERGVSPELQRQALERATALLLEIAGGEAGPVVEVCDEQSLPQPAAVTLRHQRLERVLGAEIADSECEEILQRLGMAVTAIEGGWAVVPPPFRFDIAIEVDLIEEIGRIHGYDELPSEAAAASLDMGARPEASIEASRLRSLLVDRGYQEAITYSFVDPKMQRLLDPEHEPIALSNPISADMSVMRTMLWPGLLQALQHNLNRQQERVRLFEIGRRFRRLGDETRQERVISGVICGAAVPEQWAADGRNVDFFDLKGDVESLLDITAGSQAFSFVAAALPALHPGQSARVLRDGEEAGWIGALHPEVERSLGLPMRAFVFELVLEVVSAGNVPKFAEISKFQANRRDIAMIVDSQVSAAQLIACARKAAPAIVIDLKLFDVYEGEGIDIGRKSIALGLTLQSNSRTLTDSEVDAAITDVVAALNAELGATLRQ